MCLGTCGFKEHLLCQALFMDILKVPGKVRMKRNFFARQFLYGNIDSVWDSADATNTFFQALFMEKVPGKVRKRRTLFCQALFY